MTTKKETVISIGDSISYKYEDKNYGRAEFVVCPVFKRGIMRECYIYPMQQPEYFEKYFKIDLSGRKTRVISLSSHPPFEADPRVWMMFWCKEHKCFSFELYVADNTARLEIDYHFGDTLCLDFKGRSKYG